MKKIIILVSTLLLTLTLFCVKTNAQTQGMYDINVSLSLDINNIKNTVTIDRNTIARWHTLFPPLKTHTLVSVFGRDTDYFSGL